MHKTDDKSYRQAADIIEKNGYQTFETLKKSFDEIEPGTGRVRIVKLMAGIDHPKVIEHLKDLLEHDAFKIRRAAALSLRILTNRDYFSKIYKSEMGKELFDNMWCRTDIPNPETLEKYEAENIAYLKSFAEIFKSLSKKWSYDDIPEKYFTFRRKKRPELSENGRLLYKRFNYSMDLILNEGKKYIFTLNRISQVIRKDMEKDEKADILKCLKMSLTSRLRLLEEGLCSFISIFHHLRSEINLALPERSSQWLPVSSIDVSGDEEKISEILLKGFIDFKELHTDRNLNNEEIIYHLVMLQKRLIEFFSFRIHIEKSSEINPDFYYTLKRMGLTALFAQTHNLQLLSFWAWEE